MAVLVVRRTGGFIGRTLTNEVDLDSADDRAPEVRRLLDSIDPAAVPQGKPWPDMYTYELEQDGELLVRVPEHLMPPALRELVELVLDPTR
jgi:hypothetical protein